MAKFTYGHLPRTLKVKGHLPGAYPKAFGPRYIDVAFWDSASAITPEFGEFVEINIGDDYAREALTVVAGTTAAELAVVVRDVAGFTALGGGIISGPKADIPLSVFLGTSGQKGKIVAILGEQNTAPAVGGAVYVGTGVTTEITTGSFVTGTTYTITTVGDTDFTLIGASANTVGIVFIATGAGGGTTGKATVTPLAGTVFTTDIGSACITATNWSFAGTKFAPTTSGNYVVEVEYAG
jgi:hypothetical protein